MLKIRLTRVGKKNSPAYRVVVADHRKAVKRKFIEILGHYNPAAMPKVLEINKERALYWIGNGAQASDTVNNLMADLGILKKSEKVKKVYGKKTKKKDSAKAEPEKTEVKPQDTADDQAADSEATDAEPSEEVPSTESEGETVEASVEEK